MARFRTGFAHLVTPSDPPRPMMSIGALSKATGVPANTIRTWERRYGFPVAERTSGGHRKYPASLVPHIALVQRSLSQGHRPAQVLPLSFEALQQLVGAQRPPEQPLDPAHSLLDATLALDAGTLERGFAAGFSRWGAVEFLEQVARPFMVEVGQAWQARRLQVFHEHFASERLTQFLASRWQDVSARRRGRPIVLANLPGEDHVLGLHMVATVFAQAGLDPVFLGSNTPIGDMVQCLQQTGARFIAISVSSHTPPADARRQLAALVESLPDDVQLILGGAGAPPVEGALVFHSLRELQRWADSH